MNAIVITDEVWIAVMDDVVAKTGLTAERGPAEKRAGVWPLWEPLALCAVLLLAFGLRHALMGVRPLWLDEAYSLDVARRSLPKMWDFLRTNDSHPIGYYALLSLWIRVFGTGLAEMRSLSVLLGLLAVLLTWRIGREVFSPLIGVVAAAYVALNPFQIIASNEIRMYPLLECLALSSTWILWHAFQSPARRGWWVAYGACVAGMLYTSYYAFLIVAAQALWVLLMRPRRQTVRYIFVAGAVALVLYAPWISHLAAAAGRVALPWRQPLTLDHLSSIYAAQTFGGYLFNTGTYYDVGTLDLASRALLLVPFAVLMVVGAVALGRINRAAGSLVGVSWIVPLLLLILASLAAGRAAAFPRHLVFLQPFAAFLIAGGIVHLPRVASAPRALAPTLAFLLTLAFLYPAVDNAQANPAYQFYRYDALAHFVAIHYKPGDAVIYFPAATGLSFRYYFDPPGQQVFITLKHQWSGAAYHDAGRNVAEFLVQHRFERAWLIFSEPVPEGSVAELVDGLRAQGYVHGTVGDYRLVGVTLFTHPSTAK